MIHFLYGCIGFNLNQIGFVLLWLWLSKLSPYSLKISVIYECAVREGANDGSVECGDGHWGGIPRLKSCWTLPSQVVDRIDSETVF